MSTRCQLVCTLLQRFSLAFLLLTTPVMAADEVGNGAGSLENLIVMAYQSIPRAINEKSNVYSPFEKNLLAKIKKEAMTYKAHEILKFNSEEDLDFVIGGDRKVAMTGSKVGDTIFFNVNCLYEFEKVFFNFERVLSLLIHELGHHHGIKDHVLLDNIGYLVATDVSTRTQIYSYSFFANSPKAYITYNEFSNNEVQILNVISGKKVVDIFALIEEKIESKKFQVANFHWMDDSTISLRVGYEQKGVFLINDLIFSLK